jgi:membrane protein YdbS with pleckstrin-like domain
MMNLDKSFDTDDEDERKTDAISLPNRTDDENDQPTTQIDIPSLSESTSQFSPEDEHNIRIQLEVHRRQKALDSAGQLPVDDTPEAPRAYEGEYKPTRKHVLTVIVDSWQRISGGLLAMVAIIALVIIVPRQIMDEAAIDAHSTYIVLTAVGAPIIILFVIFLVEIQSFMRWKNWRLEVTDTEVIITQKRSIIGRISQSKTSLRRQSIETVQVSRKWYLSFLNAYTVTFDAPGERDGEFHDLKNIRNGALLEELFS